MRDDARVNASKAHVYDLAHNRVSRKKWGDIKMGDIIEIKKNEEFCADVLLLYAEDNKKEPIDIVFVDTMNLDGETNLKPRTIADKRIKNVNDLHSINARLTYDLPDKNLDKWEGVLQMEGKGQAVSLDNICLRGCSLKNTKLAYGVVIYVGPQAKIMMNSNKPPRKVSNVMKLMDVFLFWVFAL